MAALPFIVSLLGWMPAPIEISAINSLWSAEKKKTVNFNIEDLFDFNVGYIGTAILAVFFVALGALIQYPTGQAVGSCFSQIHLSIRGHVCLCSWRMVPLLDYLYCLPVSLEQLSLLSMAILASIRNLSDC